ncbi:MAG: hypothetical protein ACPL0A_02935 [Candidatus Micrarchaeia archaeon]
MCGIFICEKGYAYVSNAVEAIRHRGTKCGSTERDNYLLINIINLIITKKV